MSTENSFPPPAIPKDPVLSWAALFGGNRSKLPSVLSLDRLEYLTSGRMGIANALFSLGLKRGSRVLVPAYHCNAMIEPIVWIGAVPVFYRIHPDTKVDLEHVEQLVAKHQPAAMLVTHYFGFPQDGHKLAEFCEHHRLPMIEDCAHAFFGEVGGQAIGSFGEYAIASPWKFFPIYDGGCIAMRNPAAKRLELKRPELSFQLKSTINTLENALQYGRLSGANLIAKPLLWLKDTLWNHTKRIAGPGVSALSAAPSSAEGGTSFEPQWMDKRMSLPSRWLMRASSFDRIISKRRSNYQKLLDAFRDTEGCHPLYPELPPTVVPYVFPLVMDEPEKVFVQLKRQRVPIIRFGEHLWPGVDAALCPVSTDLSRRVFQFPCHQELSGKELDWMIDTIKTTLHAASASKTGAAR
ncbi:DegT/DnrJ/EryC1/StrS family aminotransferase [Chitinivorax sp. PXF-14]|uniref:DegT/DnrJ/EryC1/StrS family aminotransferase n=1 Tax=Chitinivorax sp. PXF-14 TaxID=3230488 RepID=UPI0034655FDD